MDGNKVFLFIHAIWSTEGNKPLLTRTIRTVLFKQMKRDARAAGVQLIALNGMDEHVHCLFRVMATQTVASVMKQLRASSAEWLNVMNWFKEPFAWHPHYAAYSVSPSGVDKVVDYIQKQEQHHAGRSYEQELEAFREMEKLGYSVD